MVELVRKGVKRGIFDFERSKPVALVQRKGRDPDSSGKTLADTTAVS